jgi:hypothetical protein
VAKNEKGEAVSKTVEVKDIPAEEPKPEKPKEEPKPEKPKEEPKPEKVKTPEKPKEEPKPETKPKKVEGSKPTFAKALENMVTLFFARN